MKKVLFFMLTFVFCFTVANAKTVNVTVDFDYNDSNTFNVFYEFKNNTEFAKYLVANYNLLSVFSNNFSTELSDRIADLEGGKVVYSIYIYKSSDYYYLVLNDYFALSNRKSYTIQYDSSANIISSSYESSYSEPSFNLTKRNGRIECYNFFSYWQGSKEITSGDDNSYTIYRYYNDGKAYTNKQVESSIFESFWQAVTSIFANGSYSQLSEGLDLSYYAKHQIISKYTSLGYLKNVFFNFPSYDLKGYNYFYLNEVEQGVILLPNFNADNIKDANFNLYLYGSDVASTFFATALEITKQDGECEENCYYTLGDNFDYLNKDYNFFKTIIKLDLRNFFTKISDNDFGNYGYHLFTTFYTSDVLIYYDPNTWNLFVPQDDGLTQFGPDGKYISIGINQAIDSWNNLNHTVGDRLGSFGNVNPDYTNIGSNVSGGGSNSGGSISGGSNISGSTDVKDLLSKYSPSSIISSLSTCISSMFSFITLFLGAIPLEISSPIYFFFAIGLLVSIIKILR